MQIIDNNGEAQKGDAMAQYQLYFDCRDRGDNAEGVRWLRKAAEHGDAKAERILGKLSATVTKGKHP